jgi:hypothetical protein
MAKAKRKLFIRKGDARKGRMLGEIGGGGGNVVRGENGCRWIECEAGMGDERRDEGKRPFLPIGHNFADGEAE